MLAVVSIGRRKKSWEIIVEPPFHVSKTAFQETIRKARDAGYKPVEGPKVLLSKTVMLKKGSLSDELTSGERKGKGSSQSYRASASFCGPCPIALLRGPSTASMPNPAPNASRESMIKNSCFGIFSQNVPR